jgi:hypothetical protein
MAYLTGLQTGNAWLSGSQIHTHQNGRFYLRAYAARRSWGAMFSSEATYAIHTVQQLIVRHGALAALRQ